MAAVSTPPTIGQHRLMQYIRMHHDAEWVEIRGRNRMAGKGLKNRGYLELKVSLGKVLVRLTDPGREYLDATPPRSNDYLGGALHRLF